MNAMIEMTENATHDEINLKWYKQKMVIMN